MSRLISIRASQAPSYLTPNIEHRPELRAATHPSDHNAVFAFQHAKESEAAQKRRREKIAKREAREAKKGEREREGRNGHDPAFLVPVPMYYYGVMPVGCAAGTGSVVTGGAGSCATVSSNSNSNPFPLFLA